MFFDEVTYRSSSARPSSGPHTEAPGQRNILRDAHTIIFTVVPLSSLPPLLSTSPPSISGDTASTPPSLHPPPLYIYPLLFPSLLFPAFRLHRTRIVSDSSQHRY
ncbi:hypothetical protein L227DRAFT_574886, partial [Lentinus tigrinus ALCF2SS1-6]